MQQKKLAILLFCATVFMQACSHKDFVLQNGDLLFAVGKENTAFVNAIKNSTSGAKEIPFSHVGIAEIAGDSTYVIEATSPEGVVRTPLAHFFADALSDNNKTYIAVGRLKKQYRYSIPQAIHHAKSFLGNGYDYAYDETNNTFYCSELVRIAFTDSTGNQIFPPLAMSFKNKETGETEPFWTEHYKKLGIPVPEGKPGTNPMDMYKSSVIDIVHTYY